jgi:hypothetical protein
VRGRENCPLGSKRLFSPHFRSNSLLDKGSGITTSPAALTDITREHPECFREPDNNYKPCLASVVFQGERHARLGLPEYARRARIPVY